jgi:hypothetical protein
MPYRDSDRLGPKSADHSGAGGGAGSWLGAAILGALFAPLFLYLAFTGHVFSPKLLVGAVVMGGFGWYAFQEYLRLRSISVGLHENGMVYASSEVQRAEILWSEILALEARYVQGMRKRGTADEGNRVSTGSGSFLVPKELDRAPQLWRVIEEKTAREPKKVLLVNGLSR